MFEDHRKPTDAATPYTVFTGQRFTLTASCGRSPSDGSGIDFTLAITPSAGRFAEQSVYYSPQGDKIQDFNSSEFNGDEPPTLRLTQDQAEFGSFLLTDQKHHCTEIRWYTRVEALPGEGPLECSTDVIGEQQG